MTRRWLLCLRRLLRTCFSPDTGAGGLGGGGGLDLGGGGDAGGELDLGGGADAGGDACKCWW